MLETAHKLIKRTAKKAGLSDQQAIELIEIDKAHIFEIHIDNGKKFKAYRVQHNNRLGPYKGGIRFHPGVDMDETRALATLMSLKTSAVGLPLGGAKGGVQVDPKTLTANELEQISREYVKKLYRHIGPDKDIPAPDVNTDAQIIDWMVDEYQKQTGDSSKASFTGKNLENGGSAGREAATGRGGVYAFSEMLKNLNRENQKLTYAIQGFGNVGSFFGLIAEQQHPNWRMIAVTDSSGGVVSQNGLSPSKINKFKSAGNALVNYEFGSKISNEDLIGLKVDVLILAALGSVINEKNSKLVKAKYILELANGPISEGAYDSLYTKGTYILPDIIANSGGVIVSYLEWLQNKKNEKWSEQKVNLQLHKYIEQAVTETMDLASKEQLNLKEAAFTLAIRRLTDNLAK